MESILIHYYSILLHMKYIHLQICKNYKIIHNSHIHLFLHLKINQSYIFSLIYIINFLLYIQYYTHNYYPCLYQVYILNIGQLSLNSFYIYSHIFGIIFIQHHKNLLNKGTYFKGRFFYYLTNGYYKNCMNFSSSNPSNYQDKLNILLTRLNFRDTHINKDKNYQGHLVYDLLKNFSKIYIKNYFHNLNNFQDNQNTKQSRIQKNQIHKDINLLYHFFY